MSSKITIIGAGSVGSTIAYTLSSQDIASEIVLIDINKKKAEGEVLDIIQGTCFRDPISIIAGDYEDARDSDIVIITSGIARNAGKYNKGTYEKKYLTVISDKLHISCLFMIRQCSK